MVSSLVSYFGLTNFALAEDIVQDTFVAALDQWALSVPDDPQAWLFRVCRNKTINVLQKKGTHVVDASSVSEKGMTDRTMEHLFLDHEIKDNQLRLLFACCHPSLSPKSQIIFILKYLCGLKVEEISRALVMNDDAVMKNLSRSKETLSQEIKTLQVPFLMRSHERLNSVHTSIYLLFNEGYAATQGEEMIRRDLCIEAMRLIRSIVDIPEIRNHDTFALFALMCLHASRFDSRIGTGGEVIELELQDRTKWDRDLIQVAVQYLRHAHESNKATRFIIEAAIASVHCVAEKFEETNWSLIVGLYDRLSEIQSTPFVDLNRSVAIYYASGPVAALDSLQQSKHLSWLSNYYLYHAMLGKINAGIGKTQEAVLCYEKALSLAKLKAEQDFLYRKILTIQTHLN